MGILIDTVCNKNYEKIRSISYILSYYFKWLNKGIIYSVRQEFPLEEFLFCCREVTPDSHRNNPLKNQSQIPFKISAFRM